MVKYKLVFTNAHLKALLATVTSVINDMNVQSLPLPERISISVLGDWFGSKEIKALLYHFEGERSVKIKQHVAMALAWIIGHVDLVHDDYLGNYLFKISNEIYEFYDL